MSSQSLILKLTSEKCSQLLSNGTVRMLVLLYHSHNIYHPADRTTEEMVQEYMKKANLKRDILKTLNHIIDHEMKSWDSFGRTFQKKKKKISKNLEALRNRIHEVYLEYSEKSTKSNTSQKHDDNSTLSCVSFSEYCSVSVEQIKMAMNKDNVKTLFEQFGGFYVLVDVWQTHFILHNKDCADKKCVELIDLTLKVLSSICRDSRDPCRQFTDSPFHLTMFIDLIVNNRTNSSIVRSAAWTLGWAFNRLSVFDSGTLQDCQAIPRLTEVMMQTTDDWILNGMRCLINMILSRNRTAREEFMRIDGAVLFVISKFVESFSWAKDNSEEEYKQLNHADRLFCWFSLFNKITFFMLPTNLAIQNQYWDANVSIILVGIIKVACKVMPNSDSFAEFQKRIPENRSLDTNLCIDFESSIKGLLRLLRVCPRERVRVRELVGVHFFREILTYEWINQIYGGDLCKIFIGRILGLLEQK